MTGLTEAWMEVLVGETLRVQGPVEAGGPVVGGAGAGRLYRRRRGRGEPQLDRKENKSREEKHIDHRIRAGSCRTSPTHRGRENLTVDLQLH